MSPDTIIRMPEVSQITGLSIRTIQRSIAAGTFPPKKQLSARCVGWRRSDITAWMEKLR